MGLSRRVLPAALALLLFTVVLVPSGAAPKPLRFRITLDAGSAAHGAHGRMLLFMTDKVHKRDVLTTGFVPGNIQVAAAEIEYLSPGATVEFNPDEIAFPHPLSQNKQGRYQVMALLDTDHSFAYTGINTGDIYSAVETLDAIDPADTPPVALTLSRVDTQQEQIPDTENVKLARFESPLLSAFWGRPIFMRAGVVLPPADPGGSKGVYPTVFHVHGFGGDMKEAWYAGPGLVDSMRGGKRARMIHVFLDGSFPTGHHEFADSVNNGPWGRALVTEFIPWLEKQYPLAPEASARFLTGHSSGGWSTLWLQITYPDFFGGTWSTAPDPVDMRRFTGVNVTPGSTDNMYVKPDGTPHYLVRENGHDVCSIKDFVLQEDVTGEYGGQFASFEWVFSPRGQDGRPMKLFNHKTGEPDTRVQAAWRKYDIHAVLADNWQSFGPRLQGKIHVICGGQDTFHLEEAVTLLCQFLRDKGADATCEIVPGRNHMDLYNSSPSYPHGLDERIDREMAAAYRAASKPLGPK